LHLYVTNVGNGKVSVISGLTIVKRVATTSTSYAIGAAYDEANDKVYVTGFSNGEVYVLP
jgi:DNA-binding beta-propeller fold protein YncE